MSAPPRPATGVLTEALGDPRRHMIVLESSGTPSDAVGWDCGCRVRSTDDLLRSWQPCASHYAFRDAVMAQLAIASKRER